MRLFFALWPDDLTRARLADAGAVLSLIGQARPVPPENYHVTLAFIGSVEPPQLALLQQIGRGLRATGCAIRFDVYDYWPQPQVVVAAARQIPPALMDLWECLRQELALHSAELNREQGRESLRVHVTLARKVAQAPVLQAMSPIDWTARSLSLVSSDTSGAQSVYTVVDTWPLLDEMRKL